MQTHSTKRSLTFPLVLPRRVPRILPRILLRTLPLVAVVFGLGGVTGCPEDKAPPRPPCCEQPAAAPGVAPFKVTEDDAQGSSDGQTVKMKAEVGASLSRDSLYPILHALYRHAMTRGPFEPIVFSAEVTGTGRVLGKIERSQSEVAPRCENGIPYSFAEQVERAFAGVRGRATEEDPNDTCHMAERKKFAVADEGFKHRPTLKIDAASHAASVTWPFLELGKDDYLAALTFNAAMRDWIDVTAQLFRKVPDLKAVTFTGVYNDAPALTITATRNDFDSRLAGLQEDISAHAAVTFASLGLHKTDDKGAAKEQQTFQTKTYKAALAGLPKNQVSVSPKLK